MAAWIGLLLDDACKSMTPPSAVSDFVLSRRASGRIHGPRQALQVGVTPAPSTRLDGLGMARWLGIRAERIRRSSSLQKLVKFPSRNPSNPLECFWCGRKRSSFSCCCDSLGISNRNSGRSCDFKESPTGIWIYPARGCDFGRFAGVAWVPPIGVAWTQGAMSRRGIPPQKGQAGPGQSQGVKWVCLFFTRLRRRK